MQFHSEFYKGVSYFDAELELPLDAKFGFVDRSGKEIVKIEHDVRLKVHERVFNLVGIGNLNKSWREWSFLPLPTYSEGLVVLKKDGKWGFINTRGKIEIQFICDWAGAFSEGLAPIAIDGKYGYINKVGRIAIALTYDEAGWFSEGLAPVRIDDEWNFIDSTGEVILEIFDNDRINSLSSFSDGLAVAGLQGWDADGYYEYNKHYVIYDKGGECIGSRSDRLFDFSNGLALAIDYNLDKKKEMEYYVDTTGKIYIDIWEGMWE